MTESNPNIIFNISGGNNQILPNATHAEQHFYGNNNAPLLAALSADATDDKSAEALSKYISDPAILDAYVSKLSQCTEAHEVAEILFSMTFDDNVNADKCEVVKGRFIEHFIPFCTELKKGRSISNLRARINDWMAKRPRK